MLRYGLSTRKSHDDKKLTEKSIGEQIAECRALATREGLALEWTGEESKSAKIPRVRPKYTELIRLIERGKIDAILCWHVNRLVRNMEEGGKLVQLLIDGKIQEIRTPHATYRSGENILPVVLEAASATQYSLDLVHTVARSMDGNFRAGGWNHKAPPGYRNVRDPLNTKRGQIERDPERFALARKAWDRMLSGTETVMSITRSLEEWGYRVRPTLNLPGRKLGYNAVLAMFRNPFYAGYVKERGQVVKGRHEAMVSIEEFRRVQALLARKTFTGTRRHEHYYAGMLKCGYCGQQITGETRRVSSGIWENYRCSDSKGQCTKRGIGATEVDKQISRAFSGIEVDPEVLEIAAEEIKRGLTQRQEAYQERAEQTTTALQHIDQRLRRLTEMWLSGLMSDEVRYKELESEALAEKNFLQMSADEASNDFNRMLQHLAEAVTYLKTGQARFEAARPERKRLIAHALGSFIFYGREKTIHVEIRPLLREVVSFAKGISVSFEPPKTSSGSKEKTTFAKSFHLGRTDSTAVELPESLEKALLEDGLPKWDLPESEDQLLGAGSRLAT